MVFNKVFACIYKYNGINPIINVNELNSDVQCKKESYDSNRRGNK